MWRSGTRIRSQLSTCKHWAAHPAALVGVVEAAVGEHEPHVGRHVLRARVLPLLQLAPHRAQVHRPRDHRQVVCVDTQRY